METRALSVVFGDRDLDRNRSLRSDLRNLGMEVSAANSTHEVLAMAKRHPPDAVVLDESIEDLGRELLVRLIRNQVPGARIILIHPEHASLGAADRLRLGLAASFTRPAAAEDLRSAICATANAATPAVPGPKPPLIMCVDDDSRHLNSLLRVLGRRGYSVIGFRDPEQALEAIPVARPDLLFLDVLMPGMNGLDLAQQVRELFAEAIPVVLLTGRTSDREIADGYRKGVTHYLTKPCDTRAILSVARFLLGDPPGSEDGGGWPEPQAAADPEVDAAPDVAWRHLVVCVDDEPQILSSLRRLLRNEPYEVLTTDRPEQALDWVDQRDVSLVISDQRMPDMLGTQLLQEVSRRSPSTGRIILTGYPGRTVRMQGLNQGIERLLYKPWDDASLKRTILKMLRDREARGRSTGAPGPGAGPSGEVLP